MRTRTLVILLTTALTASATVAIADPDRQPAPRDRDPDQQAPDPRAAPGADRAPDPRPRPFGPREDRFRFSFSAGKGRLGMVAVQISPELRAHLGGARDAGVLVDAVRADSPAARAGLRVGDLVVAVDEAPVGSVHDVVTALSARKRGEPVALEAVRGGQRVELRATLADDPGPTWRDGRGSGATMPGFEWFGGEGLPSADQWRELRRTLEEMSKRMERLEQRRAPGSTQRI